MSLPADEVRRALQPMIDRRTVHLVQPGAFATLDNIGAPGQRPRVSVLLNDDSEANREEACRLVREAGLDVELAFGPNPIARA